MERNVDICVINCYLEFCYLFFLIKGIKGCIVSFLCIGVYGYGLFYKVKSNLRFYLFYIFVENKSY